MDAATPRRAPSLARRLALSVAVLLAALALGECAAGIWIERFAGPEPFRRYASLGQLVARGELASRSFHRYLGFFNTPNWSQGENRHDALGLRGEDVPVPKPEGEFRIVCAGGSTTYTSHVEDWRLAWPAQLERELRERGRPHVRVLNAGTPGWGSLETLVNFELRLLELEPDLLIVYHAINDVHPRLVWPPELYRGDQPGFRGADRGLFMPPWVEHSALARILLVEAGWMLPHSALSRTLGEQLGSAYSRRFLRQRRDGVYPRGIFGRVSAAEMLAANPPVHFERNLASLVTVARAHGVRPVLATFAWCTDFDDPEVSSPEYDGALEEMNAVTRAVAARAGAELYDFAQRFPREARWFSDGRHLNAEGAALKARLFADFLLERDLVP